MASMKDKAHYSGKAGGKAGAAQQQAQKRVNMAEALSMLERGRTTEAVAAELGVSLSTAQGYRRELIRSGRWKPVNYRHTEQRHAFLKANINKPLEWFVEKTGMAKSTLARDLKKLGRTDIKLSDDITGKGKLAGSSEKLRLEFADCHKWARIHKAMTTKQRVQL